MAFRHAPATRNSIATAVTGLVGATGKLAIYTGSVNATNGSAPSGTLLGTVNLGSWGAASGGASAGADPASVNAVATGTAGCFTLTDNAGTIVGDGTVTATGGGGDVQLVSVSITSGQPIDVTSISYTAAA